MLTARSRRSSGRVFNIYSWYNYALSKVPSIRVWLNNDGAADDDYIDVHLDDEYMQKAHSRVQSVAESLLHEPVAHQRWFRKSSSIPHAHCWYFFQSSFDDD